MADAESESTMQGGVRCCVNELFTERLRASLLLPVGVGTSLLSSRNSGKPDEVGFSRVWGLDFRVQGLRFRGSRRVLALALDSIRRSVEATHPSLDFHFEFRA